MGISTAGFPTTARTRVPELDQISRPVPAGYVGLWEPWVVPILAHGVPRLADQSGEPAEGDPLVRIDPKRGWNDPLRRMEIRLLGQPLLQFRHVVIQLAAPAAVAATGSELTRRPGEPRTPPPELPDVVICPAMPIHPGPQRRHPRRDFIGRLIRRHRPMIGHERGTPSGGSRRVGWTRGRPMYATCLRAGSSAARS